MSSIIKCKLCSENLVSGHPYTAHKIKLATYIDEHEPKFDLYTGEKILWKGDLESYLLKDFNNKNNLKNWLKQHSIDEQKEYLRGLLLKRKEYKNLIYAPTQVELRSIECMPGIVKFNEVFGDYYQLCRELGFKDRGFIKLDKNSILKREKDINKEVILCDTREQDYIKFNNIEISTLNVADYTLKENNYNIFVERKSLNDLVSTFGPKNFNRFKNELIRARDSGAYIVMLVENDINTCLGFDHSPFYNRHTQMTASYLFHQIRLLLQEFRNWQIAFCKNRADMKIKIEWVFSMGEKIKQIDFQLATDLKLFLDSI